MSAAPAISDQATENNQRLFKRYARIFSNADPTTYAQHAQKLSVWLSDYKAYYVTARPEIIKLLLVAQGTLRRALGIPIEFSFAFNIHDYPQNPYVDPYTLLVKSIMPYSQMFLEPSLAAHIRALQHTIADPTTAVNQSYHQHLLPSSSELLGPSDISRMHAPLHGNGTGDPDIEIIENPNVPTVVPITTQNASQSSSVLKPPNAAVPVRRAKKRKTLDLDALAQTDIQGLISKQEKAAQPSRDIAASQSTPQPQLTGQPMEIEINPNSTVGSQLMAAPNASTVQNATMEQTGATMAPTGPPLQQDVQVDSKNDTEKNLPPSEPTIAVAEELILTQDNLPEALEVPDVPMEVDHVQVKPIHQVEPTREDSQHMDMDVDNLQSLTEAGNSHNAEDSPHPSSAAQETENQRSPSIIIPPVSVPQPASPPQLSGPTGLSNDTIPVSDEIGSQDQVQGCPIPLQTPQKPNTVESNSTEKHSSEMDTSTGETTQDPAPITEISGTATSRSEADDLEKTAQIQPPVTSIAHPVLDPSIIFTSEMRVVASEKGRKESVATRMKFDIPETDFQLLLAWVGRSSHQSIEKLRSSVCLSLGCYLTEELHKNCEKEGNDVFEQGVFRARSTWPVNGALVMNVELAGSRQALPLAPPIQVTPDNLVDISTFLAVGPNVCELRQYQDLSQYTFVLHAHYPTRAQLSHVEEQWKKNREWQDWIRHMTRPLKVPLRPTA
ncbi:hypothetical protein HYPSUDRAFT_212475 [Hypholoma sublateritium FD-334 SS-4]|uniref:Uncharacterized protein n=1 Tax=Hypholoma sublateritium (strain FD-334 SS-4) TaxID=945553 RepID=A0A0D2PFH8_HYPSF|nr:hypothetical protein HYPSUDRAFT_212475 [Hypholoma sublateritium FD-334 SS-4]